MISWRRSHCSARPWSPAAPWSRAPKMPPSPALAAPAPTPPPLPSVEREVVTVTRDDDPVHTRPTVEAPPPTTGKEHAPDEPPSTKPSRSRKVPASLSPRSAPRSVSLEDQLTRAMKRIERQARVPPEVEARWEERLRGPRRQSCASCPDTEPTDAQIERRMIRELLRGRSRREGRPAQLSRPRRWRRRCPRPYHPSPPAPPTSRQRTTEPLAPEVKRDALPHPRRRAPRSRSHGLRGTEVSPCARSRQDPGERHPEAAPDRR